MALVVRELFREEALRRHAAAERRTAAPARVPGWWFALLWVGVALLLLASIGLFLVIQPMLAGDA
ncbi:hypothetical protein ACFHYQ_00350 [Sphaerimonospora cavernae]|uniref:DUF2474 domain-containing protein n=1 Tax=Sphaerimonospora cavernae TaxID=1740611 RepID=A0ABV6TX15_9ACTN